MSATSDSRQLTLSHIARLYERGEKIVMLTAYDASFATLAAAAGVELLLVGDSLGMVIQGHTTTLPVTMADMIYHVRAAARGAQPALVITDMPFGSYQGSPETALQNAVELMAAGAQMVKLEGGHVMQSTVRFLVERGIPVCGHLGLTPQSVHQLGGFRIQGRTEAGANEIKEDARLLQEAGVAMIVLEAMPSALATEVTHALRIPTIGIGAGADCSGQVLVLYDMLGIYPGRRPTFVRNFLDGCTSVRDAVECYVKDVKAGRFPGPEHSFK